MVQGPLGEAIERRLAEVGVSVKAFTQAGYISSSTYFRVVSGSAGVRHGANTAALERGLGWIAGSVNEVRNGGTSAAIPVRAWPRADGDWKAAVEQAWEEWDAEPSAAHLPDSGAADPVTVAISKEIKVWLIRRELTERDLIEATGISRTVMASRLSAQTDWTVAELLAVANALQVSPVDLLEFPVEQHGIRKQ